MKKNLLILCIALIGWMNCLAQQDSLKIRQRSLPLGKKWFIERNIDLPLPFGVSAFFAYMSRGVDITNVDVAFADEPKQSINDFASFDLNNKSFVSAIKLDAWLLPFLNIYGMLGNVTTNASLDATITIDRVVLPGPPIIIPINNQSTIKGLYYGIGSSVVAGHGSWFVLGDANYGYSNLSEFEGQIDFWMFSGRTGFQSKLGKNSLRTWIGGMYLSSNRTLHLNLNDDILGLIEVDVYQKTNHPFTVQLGTSIGLGKHFEILGEIGTNFEDASIGVLTSTYRF